jgi:glyoxylase I family protein
MTEKITVTGLHHASVIVHDLQQSLLFYRDILGLRSDPSRGLSDYNGAWLWAGEQQIHLLELPNPDPAEGRPAHVGRDRHVALCIQGLDGLCQQLEAAHIPYTRSKSGRRAIFCRDPDKNGLEFVEI